MGSGSSRKRSGAPTIIRTFRREISNTQKEISTSLTEDFSPRQLNDGSSEKHAEANVVTTKSSVTVKDEEKNNGDKEKEREKKSNDKEVASDQDFVQTIIGRCNAKWPIRCYRTLDFNVNAYHGGCTALYFVSCAYSGKKEESAIELMMIRSGYDCNHVQKKTIATSHKGHFGAENTYYVDEEGMFVADCLFGTNDLMLLTNDCRYGNLRNGIFMESSDDCPLALPLNVNGSLKQHGSGISLILCSGASQETNLNALYIIRLGEGGNNFDHKILSGEDQFQFGVTEDGHLTVKGAAGSRYGIFHNRNINLTSHPAHVFVSQNQCTEGTDSLMLTENLNGHSSIVVMCSNSNGTEDSTVSSIYHLSVKNGDVLTTKELSGCHGPSYERSDLWAFEIIAGQLLVTGPTGPCKYGLLSNIKATKQELLMSVKQGFCLGSGEPTKTSGSIKVNLQDITGEINKLSEICIMMNHKIIQMIPVNELTTTKDGFRFQYQWTNEEKVVGYHMIRVFAVRKHVKSGEDVYIELSGSPYPLIRQKPGVVYALNCAGPAYQDLNDIVYSSEHKQFANFTYDFMQGNRSRAIGGVKRQAKLPAQMLKSHDGFLYVIARSTFAEDEHDQRFCYEIKDLPNGKFRLRLHLINDPKDLLLNGKTISKEIVQKINATRKSGDPIGPACYCVDIEAEITSNRLELSSKSRNVYQHADHLCAFALLDNSYQDSIKSKSQMKEDEKQKQKLADTVLPLHTSATRKEMTIVGWSPNLLQNPSGGTGDLKHWNTSGDIKVSDKTGYGTDSCFVTSHMWCSKYQEVNLLDNFTAEYLDTAPDIQVMEMYKEGCCGGGFYCFTAQILSEDGKILKEYTTGDIGSIYIPNTPWQEASVVFTDYGPGARIVSISSKGKDDKFWAGHFGVFMSAAEIRVRRESNPAEGDSFTDITEYTDVNTDVNKMSAIEKLVSRILLDNQPLLQEFVEEESIPVDKQFEQMTQLVEEHKFSPKKLLHRRKKREIRVFVSSTFKDFTKEREEIIKKAFRELNRYCADRGVFFTYVDLRWGITSEQTSDGKTISICLQEIDRCRPYFICLMGDRFGWCQRREKVDGVLNMTYDYAIQTNPNLKWIEDYRFDASVTQLEVFHGVLNNPDAAKGRCFFYFRETPSPEGFTEEQYKRLISESEWHKERQEWLKGMVKSKTQQAVRMFKGATEVSNLIKQDLELCVDEDFPKGTELTKLEQQKEAHSAFSSVRCRVYIGRQDYFTEINNHRNQNINKPFVILGESGCGKSALVANWVKQIEDSEPSTFMFVHFIGSSADSAHYIKLLRRLFEEMKIFFNFDMEIPASDSMLIQELGKWLRMAGSLTKVVVVLDALNQLDDGSGDADGAEHNLLWIPSEIPPNVFLLLSTLPGPAMTACIDAGWPSMKVQPLQESQKMQILTDYLEGIYGKTLNKEQKDMIVNAQQTSNPLYLKSLLDEVRVYGSFRTLTQKLQDYLSAATPQDLFAKILERLEDDFEKGEYVRQGLVCETTTAIWCSHKGMSESELMEILNVPSIIWSPFYLSLLENLVNRNGILNFFHDHLRQAVEKKYLSSAEEKRKRYLELADFHSAKETSNRTVEELPFLFTKAGELDRLKATVTDLDVFYRLSDNEDGLFELVKAWKTLGGFSLSEEAYVSELEKIPKQKIMDNAEYYCKLYSHLGHFFLTLGLMEAAKMVYKTLIKQLELTYGESHGTVVYNAFDQSWKYRCKHPDVIRGLHELGTVYNKLGEYDKAIAVYNDAICRQNKVETPSQELQLCEGLLGLSAVYIHKGDMSEAKKLMIRSFELAECVLGRKHHFVAAIFMRLGQLSYKQGRIDEALAYYMLALKVTRSEVGTNHPRTAVVLNEIGLVYDDKNDVMAGQIYEAALSIILETYGKDYLGTGTIRYNLGAFYFGTNYFAKAKYQFTESYKIHAAFLGDDHPDTIAVKQALDTVAKMTHGTDYIESTDT